MSFFEPEVKGKRVEFNDGKMSVYLADGRILSVPLDWYPRLERATMRQRKNYKFIYDQEAMEWPDIDEHISIAGLLRGNKAPRSQAYLTGKFSDELESKRKQIEASYRSKKAIPIKRVARTLRSVSRSKAG